MNTSIKNSVRSNSSNKTVKKLIPSDKKKTVLSKKSNPDDKKKTLTKSKSKILKTKSVENSIRNSKISTIENEDKSNELKINQNVDTISRLINNSKEIMDQQNNLLEKCEEMTKKITSSDFEIERLINKNEKDDFSNSIEKYSSKLNMILNRLKNHTEEVEEIKYIKEENKNLKYKLELMTIDKSDSGLQYESRYSSLKNFTINEFNSLNEFLVDLGNENFGEEGIAFFLQNLKKLIKDLRINVSDKENELNVLNCDNRNLQEEIKILKSNLEQMKWNKNPPIENNNKEDLFYYKTLVKDYEKQIEDFKRMNLNNKISHSLNYTNTGSNEKFSFDMEKNRKLNNFDNEKGKFKEFNDYRDYKTKDYTNQYEYNNTITSMNNSSLEGFRRNKDLRASTQTNLEDNIRLENKYSDTNFYKSDANNNYNNYNNYD